MVGWKLRMRDCCRFKSATGPACKLFVISATKFWIQYGTYTHILCSICGKGACIMLVEVGLKNPISSLYSVEVNAAVDLQENHPTVRGHKTQLESARCFWPLLWCRVQMSAYSEKVFTNFHCICIVSGHFVDQLRLRMYSTVRNISFIYAYEYYDCWAIIPVNLNLFLLRADTRTALKSFHTFWYAFLNLL